MFIVLRPTVSELTCRALSTRSRYPPVSIKPNVNFINVKRTNISYERHFSSYILALSKNSYERFAHFTLMKLTPIVNFTNILRVAFALIFFRQKITNPNCKKKKGTLNSFAQESCS